MEGEWEEHNRATGNCTRSELSSSFNGPEFRHNIYNIIYIFQVDCHSVNVLNVSTCI